jgi:hypothetical protein
MDEEKERITMEFDFLSPCRSPRKQDDRRYARLELNEFPFSVTDGVMLGKMRAFTPGSASRFDIQLALELCSI